MEWWAGWWDSVAAFFGYDSWQWGSAADWFAAIGTVGALLLGLELLRRERQRERLRQANELISWIEPIEGKPAATVHVYNAGSQPIPYAMLVVDYVGDRLWKTQLRGENGEHVIPPGHTRVGGLVLAAGMGVRGVWLQFSDTHGAVWTRDLQKGKYIRGRAKKALKREDRIEI